MNLEKPLKVATCTKCDAKFFIPDSRRTRDRARYVRTHDAAPGTDENRDVFPFDCPRCKHSQYVELVYGP